MIKLTLTSDTDNDGNPDYFEAQYVSFEKDSDLDADGMSDFDDQDRDGHGINGGSGQSHSSENHCDTCHTPSCGGESVIDVYHVTRRLMVVNV